jgi:fatty acid desaturase
MAVEVTRTKEREFRSAIEAVIPPDELRALERPSWRTTTLTLAVLWVEIAALLTAANLLVRLPLALAIITGAVVVGLIATRVNALNVVMHEASHGFLARSRSVNDRVCNMAASWWMLHSVEEYRPTHRLHHRYLNSERDPDLVSYLVPATPGGFAGLVLQDLTGVTAVRRALTLLRGGDPDAGTRLSTPTVVGNLAGKALAQVIVLGQFVLVQGWWTGLLLYAVFWLFPVLCLFPLILRLKTIAEHFDPRLRLPDELWVARTSAAGRLQDHVLGAQMEYHFEHHVLPTIPFRGLKHLHHRLDAADFFESLPADARAELLSGGYVRFVRRISRPEARSVQLVS